MSCFHRSKGVFGEFVALSKVHPRPQTSSQLLPTEGPQNLEFLQEEMGVGRCLSVALVSDFLLA